MKKAYLRRHDCCDQELLNIIENRRSEDLVEDNVKKKVNQDWDLIIAAVKSWDAKAMVFRFGKHEMCPTLEEVHRIFEISLNVLFVPREGRPRESRRPVE